MSIQRTYYCDGPDCGSEENPVHASTASPPPHLPPDIIEVRGREAGVDEIRHFCGWGCLMKYAAGQPIPEVVP